MITADVYVDNKAMEMLCMRIEMVYKGIFWYIPQENKLLAKKVACRRSGEALEESDYSSKSG